ncbi:hypothetical protein [Roseofilum casamattae]|uniref:Uncharacterized protein n=1 Tax=Roseofilum casamattae BLCC-M143 TaxID=3022442 RepID=A0ABT7BRI9_9CYAN|nr:hypothetical protein [Roseofilum casamattae]MDJ1181810.1 hypothetical protein [Roseofilum casamattae BLCC-M143]
MHSETQQLLTILETLSAATVYSLVGDEPYQPWVWEIGDRTELTIERILRHQGNLQDLEPDEFWMRIDRANSDSSAQIYGELRQWLERETDGCYYFNYEISPLLHSVLAEIPEQERDRRIHVPVILAELTSGEYLGLCPKQRATTHVDPAFILPLFSPTDIAREKIAALQELTANLSLSSSITDEFSVCDFVADSPFWEVVCRDGRSTVLEQLLQSAGFLEIREINRFFRIEEDEEFDEDEEFEEDRRLREFFNDRLQDSRAIEFSFVMGGEFYTSHYAIGKTPPGDWIGATTISYTC